MRTIILTFFRGLRSKAIGVTIGLSMSFCAIAASAQVSPAEVATPELKGLEQDYLGQLKALNQSIAKMKFPFPFYLSRYVGLNPSQQAGTDSRGIEFVHFQDRVILKVTGNYNASYDTARLTQNERLVTTFRGVVLPILEQMTSSLPPELACDGVGFEISHHTHTRESTYDYEGKETLVVVLNREDAWILPRAASDSQRQDIVNRSQVFVSGIAIGLSLSERDPVNVPPPAKLWPVKSSSKSEARSTLTGEPTPTKLNLSLPSESSSPVAPIPTHSVSAAAVSVPALSKTEDPHVSPKPTQADADGLTEMYQSKLAALAKDGVTKYHFVEYSPPAFIVFHDQMGLQMTLRDSIQFDPAKSSIYKRAAQSFDLFLAPQLRDISDTIPADLEFQLFDFSVLNKLASEAKGTSEAIEFICPRAAVKQFVEAEITNQQLIDKSIVLVNGVRIALNLQVVE